MEITSVWTLCKRARTIIDFHNQNKIRQISSSRLETRVNVSAIFSRLCTAYNTLSFPQNFCISSVCNTQEKLKTMGTGKQNLVGGDKMCKLREVANSESFCRYRHQKRNKGTKQQSSPGGFVAWLSSTCGLEVRLHIPLCSCYFIFKVPQYYKYFLAFQPFVSVV